MTARDDWEMKGTPDVLREGYVGQNSSKLGFSAHLRETDCNSRSKTNGLCNIKMNSTASCCTINVLPCAVARLGLYKKGSVAPVRIGATSDARNCSAEIGFSRGIFMSGNL